MSDFTQWLDNQRTGGATKSQPGFWDTPLIKRIPDLAKRTGSFLYDKFRPSNLMDTNEKIVTGIGNFVQNTGPWKRMEERQQGFEQVKDYMHPVDKAVYTPANVGVGAVDSLLQFIRMVGGGVYSIGQEINQRAGLGLKGDPGIEKKIFGYEPNSITETYVDPTMRLAEEAGSGKFEKGLLGTAAFGAGLFLESPIGGPFKKGVAKKMAQKWVTSGVSRDIVEMELKNMGLTDDMAREIADSVEATMATDWKRGAKVNEITRVIEFNANKAAAIPSERSVLQVVDKNGDDVFYVIKPEDYNTIRELIDEGYRGFGKSTAVAGDSIGGKIYHLTAKTPAEMLERAGWKNGGTVGVDDVLSMIKPKRRVTLRSADGTFAGSRMEDAAFKKVAADVAEERKLIEDAKKYKKLEDFVKEKVETLGENIKTSLKLYKAHSVSGQNDLSALKANSAFRKYILEADTIEADTLALASRKALKDSGATTLYRGGNQSGYSWTTDPKIAERFGKVSSIKITDDVLDRVVYSDLVSEKLVKKPYNESEVILSPTSRTLKLSKLWDDAHTPGFKYDYGEQVRNRTIGQVQERFREIFGRYFDVETVVDSRRLADPRAVGQVYGRLMTLLVRNNSISDVVANHEGWHMFKRLLSDDKIDELTKMEKSFFEQVSKSDPERITQLKKDYPGKSERYLAEELMADEFARYYKTGTTILEKAKVFFDDLIQRLGLLFSKRTDIIKEFNNVSKTLDEYSAPVNRYDVHEKAVRSMKERIGETLDEDVAMALRESKGLSADDIMKKFPDIQLVRDVVAKDIYGNKVTIPEGEALTPYELKGGKVLLQDGETYIVTKNQFQNIKGQSLEDVSKKFAPELDELEETVRGERLFTNEKKTKEDFKILRDERNTGYYIADKYGHRIQSGFEVLRDAEKWLDTATEKELTVKKPLSTKYESYVLPGGENYKEILVRTPEVSEREARNKALDTLAMEKYGKTMRELWNSNDMTKWEEISKKTDVPYGKNFTSSHWDELNVIAHIRMNIRKYKDKAVAFMEELQSDWAREGRDKGFADERVTKRLAEIKKEKEEILRKAAPLTEKNEDAPQELIDRMTALGDEEQKLQILSVRGVPHNPMLKKWQELSIKRALKQAVDDGAEYFAWINGAQTSARYNLATYLDRVEWKYAPHVDEKYINLYPKQSPKDILVGVDKNGTITGGDGIEQGWKGKKLDEVLGKGLADKIMEKERGSLSGEGLKFGGEWAENLYDRQVKNIVEDLTGGKVETIDMGLRLKNRENEVIGGYNSDGWIKGMGTMSLAPSDVKIGAGIRKNGKEYIIVKASDDGYSFTAYPMDRVNAQAKTPSGWYGLKRRREGIGEYEELWANRTDVYQTVLKPGVADELSGSSFAIHVTLPKPVVNPPQTQMAIRLTPEIKAIIRGESPLTKKPSGKLPINDETVSMKVNPDSEYDLILTTFAGAEKGERIGVTDKDGYFAGVAAKHSTFPDWVPEDLRTRELFDKYLTDRTGDISDFDKITYKKGSRLERLDDIVRQRLYTDTGIDVRRVPDDLNYIDDLANQYNNEIDDLTGETLRSPDQLARIETQTPRIGGQTSGGTVSGGSSNIVYPRAAKRSIVDIAQRMGLPVKGIVERFEGLKRVKTNVLEYVQNTDERIRQLMERPDFKVTDKSNIYQKATLYHGRLGTRIERARDEAKAVLQDIKKTADSLGAAYDDIRSDVDDYLIARHAPERNAALGDGAAGMKTAEAEALKTKLEQGPRGTAIVQLANKIQDINNKTLDILRDSGVITPELHNQLRAKYQYHVPLYRVFEGDTDMGGALAGKGFDVRSTGIKKAKGSEKEIDDILGNVIYNYEQAIIRAEKNTVDLATLRFVRENAEALKGMMKEVKLPFVPVGTVVHKEQVFNEVMDVVDKLITQYGGTHNRRLKTGRAFGYFAPSTNSVVTRFGTSKDTLIHEFGHMLDTKFGLKDGDFFTSDISAELRGIADLRKVRQAYARKGEEKIAEFISMYFNDLDNARKMAPKATAKFDAFLEKHPELRELKDIMKSRSRAQRELEETVFAQQRFTNDPKILTLRENGKATYIKVEDPNLAIAIRGVGREKLGGILNAVRAFTNFYSGLHTRFNPDFALPNKIRDIQETITYLASQKDIGGKGAFRAGVRDPKSVKDVMDYLRGKDTEGARLYKEMKEMGGTTGGMGLSTRANVDLDIKKLDKLVNSKTRRITENLVEYVDNWNTIFEDSTRLSVYKEARARGISKERAAFLAKEASINFNRMGKGGPVINAIWMFSNASIQGSTKMLRALKNPKVAAGVAVTIGAAVAATNEWNDQVDPKWREKVPKWDRMNSLPIVLPTEDDSFKYMVIPVSWGLKPIKVMTDYAYDALSGHGKDAKEIMNGVLTSVLEGYNPVGGTDVWSSVMPTILDTPFEINRNQSWSGSSIRPINYNNAPDDTLYFKSLPETKTGEIAISLADMLAKKGIEVSPASMKYAYEQYIGGAGRFVNRMMNSISGLVTDDQVPLDEYPFVSRFYRERANDELQNTKSTETDALDSLSDEDARVKKKANIEANQLKEEVMALPTAEEKKARLREIAAENPDIVKKVLDMIDEEKAGLTPQESQLKNATVAVRAEYIRKQIEGMTTEEKKAYLRDLKEKKILTAAVLDTLGY